MFFSLYCFCHLVICLLILPITLPCWDKHDWLELDQNIKIYFVWKIILDNFHEAAVTSSLFWMQLRINSRNNIFENEKKEGWVLKIYFMVMVYCIEPSSIILSVLNFIVDSPEGKMKTISSRGCCNPIKTVIKCL